MPLILVVPAVDQLDVRSVVRAGAMDVVDIGDAGRALADALEAGLSMGRRLRADERPVAPDHTIETSGGRVITVASASAGAGKTFLATNLAWFLHHHGGRRVCIIDLDLHAGEVSRALGHQPRATVTGLLPLGDDELRAQMAAVCETHHEGISVLAAPRDPVEARAVHAEDVARFIRVGRALFDDVIIDTPARLTETVVTALRHTDELAIVGTLEVAAVRDMKSLLATLDDHGIRGHELLLVLNRVERDAVAAANRVLEMFPRGSGAVLPDGREVPRALSSGRLVLDKAPNAAISRELTEVLRRFLDPAARERLDDEGPSSRTARPRRRRLARASA